MLPVYRVLQFLNGVVYFESVFFTNGFTIRNSFCVIHSSFKLYQSLYCIPKCRRRVRFVKLLGNWSNCTVNFSEKKFCRKTISFLFRILLNNSLLETPKNGQLLVMVHLRKWQKLTSRWWRSWSFSKESSRIVQY